MRRLLAVTVLALTALLAAAASAQQAPVIVRADLDRTTMTIGDQALLTITVELARGYDLLDPGVPRAIGDLEVVDTLTVLQSRLPNGVTRVHVRYLVSAFSLGTKRVPVIVVGYRGPDGAGQAATQGPLAVQVQSVIAPGEDASDIKPLKPPLQVGDPANDIWPRAAVAAAAALLIAALVALLVMRSRSRRAAILEPVLHGAARQALTDLEVLAEMRLAEQGRTREHYDRLAGTVRRFIEARYAIGASSRTAREMRAELDRARVDRSHAQLLCEALTDAESVRYEERPIFPARAQKTLRDLMDLMKKHVVAEEYELIRTGATA